MNSCEFETACYVWELARPRLRNVRGSCWNSTVGRCLFSYGRWVLIFVCVWSRESFCGERDLFFFYFFLGSFKSPSLCVALFHHRLNIMWISLINVHVYKFLFLFFVVSFCFLDRLGKNNVYIIIMYTINLLTYWERGPHYILMGK